VAKHESMNDKTHLQSDMPDTRFQLTRVTRLLRCAQDSLHSALGTSPTYPELEEWTNVAEGTIKYWFNNNGRPTAEFALQLLERMPERQRHALLDSACRVLPSLEHPHLGCDHTIVSRLKTMIVQPHGLVFIQGGTDESRTFLATAMGHAFLSLTTKPHRVVGLDAHEPDWFVPLPGVRYFRNLFQPAQRLKAAKENWPKLQGRSPQLVVLNAMGVAFADFRRQIKGITTGCPVVIAEAAQIKPSLLKRATHGPLHIITISKSPEDTNGIAISIEAI
jgi:hypothetical protein